MTHEEGKMGDGPKVMRFFRCPWPMRLVGNRRVPKGIVPTDDHDLQRLLRKAHAVEELAADHPDVVAALTVRAAEVANGGRAAQALDAIDGDWRAKARAVGAKQAAEKAERDAATARQVEIQRAADRGDPEGLTVPAPDAPAPSPTPAVMAHLPEGFEVPAPGPALEAAGVAGAVGVFTPSAMAAGAPAGVTPEAPAEPVAAPESTPAAEAPSPAPNPEDAPLASGEPMPGFAYMTKSELREWLQKNAVNLDIPASGSKATMEKLCRGVLADANRAKQAGR
jgi:hypothetical protein